MRALDKAEKRFVDSIISLQSPAFVANLIDALAPNLLIQQSTTLPGTLDISYGIANGSPTAQEKRKAQEAIEKLSIDLIVVLNLLKMLESEGYIVLYHAAPASPLSSIGSMATNSSSISMSFPDSSFSKVLIDNWDKIIFVTPELKRFQSKGYISRDEQKFKVQRGLATGSLLISIFALLLTTYFNISKSSSPTKINNEQFSEVLTTLQEIYNRPVTTITNSPTNILCNCKSPAIANDSCKTKHTAQKPKAPND